MRLESKFDAEGLELRPVYGCSRDDLDAAPEEPIGWAHDARRAAKIINKYMSEEMGDSTKLNARDLYYSRPLEAWFTED